jgi:hypothetical protein
LLTIALALGAVAWLAFTPGTWFERSPVESSATFLGAIAGIAVAARWILPDDVFLYLRLHKNLHWVLLGNLIALAGGGIGLLAGRVIMALLR